ncbi:MAG: lysophospholipid acyltransferase family protein [Candidatus Limnocylindrales bacterium]
MSIADDFSDRLSPGQRAFRYALTRRVISLGVRCYLRVNPPLGLERLPAAPFVLCFNHLNWVDPFVLLTVWPAQPRLYVYGPKERDMRRGWRNHLITWTGMAVPFNPSKTNLLASTKRAVAVLQGGDVLAIAGEGRLSEREDEVMPIHEGPAFVAIHAGVPIVPLGLNGTRWLRFGKRVRLRIGEPISTAGKRADRETLRATTEELHAALTELVQGYADTAVPGPFGRWLTDLFNERPWLASERPDAPTGMG